MIKMKWANSQFFTAVAVAAAIASNASASSIRVSAELDCSAGTACVITGIRSNPLFSNTISIGTGDVIDITLMGTHRLGPIRDNASLTPWQIAMGGQAANMDGRPVTLPADMSFDGFLTKFDGVSLQGLPPTIHDLQVDVR